MVPVSAPLDPVARSRQVCIYVVEAGRLEEGDCGSLVVDASTGDIYGHIVAGSPESGAAYIIPAYHIYDHLKRNFDRELKLSKMTADSDAEDTRADRRWALQVLEWADSHWSRYVTLVAGIGFFTNSYNVSLLSS